MKFKLAAGAEFDVMTAHEMRKELDGALTAFSASLALGDTYKRYAATGKVPAGGALTLLVAGPPEGYIWAVKRVAVFGLADTESVALHVNDTGPSAGVVPYIRRDDAAGVVPYVSFDSAQLVLMPGDALMVVGTSLTAGEYVTVTGQVRELPRSLLWRL